jgi:hypothetical protein
MAISKWAANLDGTSSGEDTLHCYSLLCFVNYD